MRHRNRPGRSRSAAVLLTLTALLVAGLPAQAGAVSAAGALPAQAAAEEPLTLVATTAIPLPTYADMAADPGTGHVFVSGGPGTSAIVVTDRDGRVVGSVPGQPGATGLVLSGDGRTLYAALREADAVSVIDTASLTERARVPYGDRTCPEELAVTRGRLWVSYGCENDWRLGSFDLAAPAPVAVLDQVSFHNRSVRMAGDPAGDILVAAPPGVTPTETTSYDVSSGDPVQLGTARTPGFLRDLALQPGGSSALVATYQTGQPWSYSTVDMSRTGEYNAWERTRAIAVRPDGWVATGSDEWALQAFRPNRPAPVFTYLGGADFAPPLAQRGLTWGADDRLYGIGASFQTVTLRVFDRVPPGPAQTYLEADNLPGSPQVHRPLTVRARLAVVGDDVEPGAQTLHLTRTDRRGTIALPDVTSAPNGAFEFTDVPRRVGQTVYTISFAGTDTLLPSTYAITLPVVRRTG